MNRFRKPKSPLAGLGLVAAFAIVIGAALAMPVKLGEIAAKIRGRFGGSGRRRHPIPDDMLAEELLGEHADRDHGSAS